MNKIRDPQTSILWTKLEIDRQAIYEQNSRSPDGALMIFMGEKIDIYRQVPYEQN